MLDKLRRPFFVAALIAWLLVVLVELGAGFVLPVPKPSVEDLHEMIANELPGEEPPSKDELALMVAKRGEKPLRPGYAITALAAFDAFVLLGLGWMAAGLVVSKRLIGRLQGIVSLIGALVTILIASIALYLLFGLLLVMAGLFLSPPFGTIAYLAIWGFFERGAAAVTLGLLLVLKLAAGVLLLVAQQQFLQNKGLLVLFGVSLLLTLLVSFLHQFPPLVLVSITDVIAALTILVLSILWAIALLIGSVFATLRAIPPEKRST